MIIIIIIFNIYIAQINIQEDVIKRSILPNSLVVYLTIFFWGTLIRNGLIKTPRYKNLRNYLHIRTVPLSSICAHTRQVVGYGENEPRLANSGGEKQSCLGFCFQKIPRWMKKLSFEVRNSKLISNDKKHLISSNFQVLTKTCNVKAL